MNTALLAMPLLGILLASGCTQPSPEDVVRAQTACVILCKQAVQRGTDVDASPCISDSLLPGWVCDAAHDPRKPLDDDPANQCASYGSGARHFVEVDEYCDVIRAV